VFVCLTICMEQLSSDWKDFHEIWCLSTFLKPVKNFQVSLKSDKNNGYFTWRPLHIYDHILFLLRMKNVSDRSFRENKTHILCSVALFRKSCRWWDNVEKHCRAR
jgi:hypothetical protein